MTEHGGEPSGGLKEWNARDYHRVSEPQFAWGLRVLERLTLRGDERVLDAGCGSGRLTRELASRLPRGTVIGCDLSENMTRAAAETLGLRRRETGAVATERHGVVCADLLALPFGESFEAVFSTATFHWVKDHERLFTELRGALRRRGVLEAQCGGGPNLRRVHARAIALATTDTFRSYFASWDEPWAFAYPEEAEARLRRAGFASIRCWLEEAPTAFVDATRYRSFLEAVVMRPFLARLPSPDVRKHFLDVLVEQASNDERPFVLDYWRLNISATTP